MKTLSLISEHLV